MTNSVGIIAPGEANAILRSLILAIQLGFLIYKYVHTKHRHRPPKKRHKHKQQEE